ncbi:MAG: hypothetical protein PHV54_00850 [Tolumonas sp.]|nr:hypothetical protein [Tolumonas sp.]
MKKRAMKYLVSASSILDLSPITNNVVFSVQVTTEEMNPNIEDAKSLAGDWMAVGDELRNAMKKYERTTRKHRIATCE